MITEYLLREQCSISSLLTTEHPDDEVSSNYRDQFCDKMDITGHETASMDTRVPIHPPLPAKGNTSEW